jgi:hypothetical protein
MSMQDVLLKLMTDKLTELIFVHLSMPVVYVWHTLVRNRSRQFCCCYRPSFSTYRCFLLTQMSFAFLSSPLISRIFNTVDWNLCQSYLSIWFLLNWRKIWNGKTFTTYAILSLELLVTILLVIHKTWIDLFIWL